MNTPDNSAEVARCIDITTAADAEIAGGLADLAYARHKIADPAAALVAAKAAHARIEVALDAISRCGTDLRAIGEHRHALTFDRAAEASRNRVAPTVAAALHELHKRAAGPGLHDEHDVNDFRALVDRIVDRPRDVVPKTPYRGPNDDLEAAFEAGDIAWRELTPDGVQVHHDRETFTELFMPGGDQ